MSDTTCTHHNDQQREECPVCLVAQLRSDCDNETKWASHYLAQSIADKARAERAEAVLADPQQLHAHCLRNLNEGQIAHLFGERMTAIFNRAERAEADLATERETSRLLKVAMDARDEGYTQSRRRMSALERELAAGGAWLNHVLPIDCAFDDRAEIDNDIKNMTEESKK